MKGLATVARARSSFLGSLELFRLLRFAGAGVFNTVMSYLLFVLLLPTGLPGASCLAVASALTLLVSFFTSKTLVFRSTQRGRMPRFLLLYGGLIALNALALGTLETAGLPAWCAQAVLVAPIAAIGYLVQRNLVFVQYTDLEARDCAPADGVRVRPVARTGGLQP